MTTADAADLSGQILGQTWCIGCDFSKSVQIEKLTRHSDNHFRNISA